MNIFKPFEGINQRTKTLIGLGWLLLILILWVVSSFAPTHMFPTPGQVFNGVSELYKEGLIVHIFSSLALCAKAVLIAIIISLTFAYLSTLPVILPISNILILEFLFFINFILSSTIPSVSGLGSKTDSLT